MKINKMQEIAKRKGLKLEFCEKEQAYCMFDRRTGMMLEVYNDYSLKMMDDRNWRTECNKLAPANP